MTHQGLAFGFAVVLLASAPTVTAEELEVLHCYSGTNQFFSHGPIVLLSWEQRGILTSSHPQKILDAAVVQCNGIQKGGGATRTGDALCKIIDQDGDAIVGSIAYAGIDYDVKFIDGTGKWQGVTGSLRSTRTVRSADGKNGIPGTYQGCRVERGQLNLKK